MLASIQRIISLTPIPNADSIESAQVLGWTTVVRKGEFKTGDLCIWHAPDTVLDTSRAQYSTFEKAGGRLKVARIRGAISQGLALPLSSFTIDGEITEGRDLTQLVGIKKYEKPVAWNPIRPGDLLPWPSFLRKTDEPNLRNYPKALSDFEGKETYATLKYDGTSITIYKHQGVVGVCQRNYELSKSETPYWEMVKKYRIEERLADHDQIAIQAELCGAKIGGDRLKLGNNLSIFIFQVWDIKKGSFLDLDAAQSLIQTLNSVTEGPTLEWSQILWRGQLDSNKQNLNFWMNFADKLDYPKGGPAEGLVLRTVKEEFSPILENRLSAKVISERYCLKHGE